MSEYPPEVESFHNALKWLVGVVKVDTVATDFRTKGTAESRPHP
jgi:hypothetical protein